MNREVVLTFEFVEFIPEELKFGTIYISIPFATASHLCCCGCGNKVVTPLSPTDWKLIFDGESISLEPSIGNWNFPCQSHYWITRNEIDWSRQWSKLEIQAGQNRDFLAKKKYFRRSETSVSSEMPKSDKSGKRERKEGVWQKVKRRLKRR
jgi:hypothetical protein